MITILSRSLYWVYRWYIVGSPSQSARGLVKTILRDHWGFKVARNSFLARAAWAADCACSREHTRLTQVQI